MKIKAFELSRQEFFAMVKFAKLSEAGFRDRQLADRPLRPYLSF